MIIFLSIFWLMDLVLLTYTLRAVGMRATNSKSQNSMMILSLILLVMITGSAMLFFHTDNGWIRLLAVALAGWPAVPLGGAMLVCGVAIATGARWN